MIYINLTNSVICTYGILSVVIDGERYTPEHIEGFTRFDNWWYGDWSVTTEPEGDVEEWDIPF